MDDEMSDFKPTHRSIGGVIAYAYQHVPPIWRVSLEGQGPLGVVCDPGEFTRLFEPIPVMVSIPLDVAVQLKIDLDRFKAPLVGCARNFLDRAIADAEKEASP